MVNSDDQPAVLKRRFVPLSEVEKILSISKSQAYGLVRSGELRGIQVGGRGQWRIEVTELEAYLDAAPKSDED